MSREDCSIYSEKFRLQVIESHKKFFEKRGIDPSNIPGISDGMSQWWKKTNAPPKLQYLQESFPSSHIEKQKNV